ncbi:hypothetical protein RND81_08G165000 [Saponaria officinalis]|uniref:Uncharacterized protein n=1 Tax=Saponaria officinalis TaxID=3572 RepID=A0AAW1J985_SAPOF
MKKLTDATPNSFVDTKQYQGYEIRYFTSEGVKLVKGLFYWMNNCIHRFSLLPNLTSETAKNYIYYDDSEVVVNLPSRIAYTKPVGIAVFRDKIEDSITWLVDLIRDIGGGKMDIKIMPPMIFHLFEVMRNFD